MVHKIKTICFFVCSNGLGHLDRVLSIVTYLKKKNVITTVYCAKWQYDLLKNKYSNLKINIKFIDNNNLKWDIITKTNTFDYFLYKNWFEQFKNEIRTFDLVVSDNLLYFLNFRNDVILLSSFFWFDVFENYFGFNRFADEEKKILETKNPLILTNEFLETGSVKNYQNKINFSWGPPFNFLNNLSFKLKNVVIVKPSLNYLNYYEKMNNILQDINLPISNNINNKKNSLFIIRPGGGMVSFCVSNKIPFISLISKYDSTEILEIAKNMKKFGIADYIYIDDNFELPKINLLKTQIKKYKQMQFNGYKKIAYKLLEILNEK